MRPGPAVAGLVAAVLAGTGAWAAGAEAPPAAPPPANSAPSGTPPPAVAITWDRAANIADAARRIGTIQRVQGADAAVKFIDACYRTHGLASAYTAAFEACIAQDYLETKMLARVYSRLPPKQLKKLGAPTAGAMAEAMGRRIVAAFRQYNVGVSDAEAFKAEVDKHGLPVFLRAVFPNAAAESDRARETPGDGPTQDEKKN